MAYNRHDPIQREQMRAFRQQRVEAAFVVAEREFLNLVIGVDAEGWEAWRVFGIGDHVLFPETNRAYTIFAFGTNGEMFGTPYPQGSQGLTTGVSFAPGWQKHVTRLDDDTVEAVSHADGIVSFS